jgi:hypothetical protein
MNFYLDLLRTLMKNLMENVFYYVSTTMFAYLFLYSTSIIVLLLLHEHKQGLGLKMRSFKASGVPSLSTFSWVFPPPTIPGVGTEELVWVSSSCPFFPSDITTYFDIILYLLLSCSLLIYYEC